MTSDQEKRALLPLLYLTHFSSFGVFMPFFPVWLQARGVTGIKLGALLATPPLVGILAPIVSGLIADALGLRAKLLTAAAVLACVASLAIAASAAALSGTPLVGPLAVLIALVAIARAPLFGLADVLALETLGANRAAFGRFRLWGSAGFLLAVVLYPTVFEPTAPIALPAAMALGFFCTILVTLRLPRTTTRLGFDLTGAIRMMRKHAGFFGTLALWQLGNATYDSTFTQHLQSLGMPQSLMGATWGLGVIAEIAAMAVTAQLLRRVSTRRLLLLGLAISSARWAFTSLTTSLWGVAALQLLHAGSFALTWTVANTMLPKLATDGRLATTQGAVTTAAAIGSAAGMFVWPHLYREHGATVVFGGGALAAFGATVCFALWRPPPAIFSH